MRAEYCTSGARARRKLACSASSVSGRSARAYGCHASSPRMPRTVLRSSCNCRAISDFDRLSAWNSRCTSRQQSSRTMRPSPSGVTSGPVSAVAAVAPVNNVSVITTALLREEGGEFSITTGGDYWVTADRHLQLRLENVPTEVRAIAWKAQLRLCKRYRLLSARGKHVNQVVVAIAREMAAFAWAIARTVPMAS